METENYAQQYAEIYNKVKDKEVALAILAEIAKDRRMSEIKNNGNNGEPATEKQLNFLKELGIKAEKGISKEQATRLISEALNNNGTRKAR